MGIFAPALTTRLRCWLAQNIRAASVEPATKKSPNGSAEHLPLRFSIWLRRTRYSSSYSP